LTAKLARFAGDNREAIRRARPDLPAALHDRAQDNWEPLLAIADTAGGEWPELARHAALTLSGSSAGENTIGNELLEDIQEMFEQKRIERTSIKELVEVLCSDDEKPWATYNRGRAITPRQISKRLRDYGVYTKTFRQGYETVKGYEWEQFEEVFLRYLSSPPPPDFSGNLVTNPENNNKINGLCVTSGKSVTVTSPPSVTFTKDFGVGHEGKNVTGGENVTVTENRLVTLKPAPALGCYRVTEILGGSGEDTVDGIVEVTI
jgi:putative DNA primase/helicase